MAYGYGFLGVDWSLDAPDCARPGEPAHVGVHPACRVLEQAHDQSHLVLGSKPVLMAPAVVGPRGPGPALALCVLLLLRGRPLEPLLVRHQAGSDEDRVAD